VTGRLPYACGIRPTGGWHTKADGRLVGGGAREGRHPPETVRCSVRECLKAWPDLAILHSAGPNRASQTALPQYRTG
jgi:hypothetical protein